MARTTSTEASADAVHPLLAVDLVDNDLATLENLGLDLGRIVEDNAGVVTSHCSHGGNGKRLAIDDNKLALPIRHVS